jgi:5'-nucleotidase
VVQLVTLSVVLSLIVAPIVARDDGGGGSSSRYVDIQILGLNDFHGQLEVVPATASSAGRIGALTDANPDPTVTDLQCQPGTCVTAGGVEYLATHVRNLRAPRAGHTFFVSAGDLIGATPLLSALFHDEPTIEAFNLMKLDFNGVGNHEFDEGVNELLRIAYGNRRQDGYRPARADGCHPVDGCGDKDNYKGATFPFLAANVTYKSNGKTIFPPYAIRSVGGVKVAFVGMTLEGTPDIVSPDGIATVNFLDEAATVNALVPKLRKQGVKAIVVLLHEGGNTTTAGNGAGADPTLINSCVAPTGNIPPIVDAMSDEVDIVITGHTNWAVNCIIDGKVVTGAAAQGRLITDIDAQLDRHTKDFVKPMSVNNRIVTQTVRRAADLTALIAEYKVVEGPIAGVPVGRTVGALNRTAIAGTSDTILGRLIADAQLAHPSVAGAQIALMNPGGIRSDIAFAPPIETITHGEAFSVQPFSNILQVRRYTGAQLDALLERQFRAPTVAGDPEPNVILQVSRGFRYEWNSTLAIGNRVSNISLNGTPIDPAANYQVAMNNFLGGGGDGFGTTITVGTHIKFGADDLVALEAYLQPTIAGTPYNPDPAFTGPHRVVRLP